MDTRRSPGRRARQAPDISLPTLPLGQPPVIAAAHAAVKLPEQFGQPQRFNTIGAIDGLLGSAVFGWAYDRDFGRRRVKITMYVNENFVAETVANGLRREMVGNGGHDGFSGFVCAIPPEYFQPGAAIRLFADGTELTTLPLMLGPRHFDGVFEPLDGATASGWVRERMREPTRAVLDMVVDGVLIRSVVADRLRSELKANGVADGCFGFAEALPDMCFDGGDHLVEFRHRASGTAIAPGAQRFCAEYGGVLERLDQHGGHGWVYCRELPDRPVPLDIVVNGERIAVVANHPRADVRKVQGVEGYGFDFGIPETVSAHGDLTVEIFVAGTANPAIPGPFRFTPTSRIIEQLEEIAAAIGNDGTPETGSAGRRYSAIRDAILPSVIAALRTHDRTAGVLDIALRVDLAKFNGEAVPVSDIVDVVIPVYSGHDETIACIESVIRAGNSTRREIILVDDCGPDPKLRAALQSYARAGTVTLVVNPGNLGFPASVNNGMSLHPDRDVILLNADTLVPRGWIDRLRAAAYRADNIGSATPLSNRATICSYPEINKDNDLPGDLAWEALDQICASVNDAAAAVELPTAVGFCAYLKRSMLNEVGDLNAERWQRGYGEENELCILAAARGWKHVLAANLFVVHHGAVSFGVADRRALLETNLALLNHLYPDYLPRVMEFLRTDPVAAVRRAVDWARLKRLSERFVLFVSHRHGGGTAIHVEDMAKRLAAQGEQALILEANADNRGTATIRNLALGTCSIYALPDEHDALIADLKACGVWHVHIHHIMGGARWAALPRQLGCPYDVTVHDYSVFCPRIDLIDESGLYCGEPAVEVCERCIALNQPHPQLQGAFRDRGGMAEWLGLHHGLLAGARRVFTPSRDTATRLERHLPGVAYEARHHLEPVSTIAVRRPASRDAARVAVIGAIGPNKGYDVLIACARDALKRDLPIQYRLFGYAADHAPLRQLGNMQLIGEYERADLPRLVAENPCDVALFLSIWPETYCYALSDAYALGLYPIALRFGSLDERISASGVGTLLPLASTPAEINDAILADIARGQSWPANVHFGQDIDDLLTGYYALQPPVRPGAVPSRRPKNRNKST
jgi:GT2 family glycosyltransferase/glycosyltransferase involved in cell wall biosynthesis